MRLCPDIYTSFTIFNEIQKIVLIFKIYITTIIIRKNVKIINSLMF